eukprot:PhF_6_TR30701/c0_g1_i1/m.45171
MIAKDPFNIARFIQPHKTHFPIALTEIHQGKKQSCWSWYIFPAGPVVTSTGQPKRVSGRTIQYMLKCDEEVIAFLRHPTAANGVNLRQNYIDIMRAIEQQLKPSISRKTGEPIPGKSLLSLLGALDAPKCVSSVLLFERVGRMIEDTEVVDVCSSILELTKCAKL